MFKVPNWEDTPSNNLNFTNISQKEKNKIKQRNKLGKQQPVLDSKPRFKAKIKPHTKLKLQNVNKAVKKLKTNKQRHEEHSLKKKVEYNYDEIDNKRDCDDDNNIKNYDADKLDKITLDVKKQKLDTYKNEDNEEIPFRENPDNITTKSNYLSTTINSSEKNTVKSKKPHSSKKGHQSDKDQMIPKEEDIEVRNNNTGDVKGSKLNGKEIKERRKKEALKILLQKESQRNHIIISSSGSKLRHRMLDRLKAAKFRYLNEKLYTSTGSDARKLFQADPEAFQTYHEGYQQQVKKWPVRPLDVIVKRIQKMPKSHKVADMGCGEAELSKRVSQPVRSFDLVTTAPGVEACDMAHTPLLAASVDVAVYCLALMGTDLTQYLLEAARVLKIGGHLLVAEVESRFENVEAFTREVQRLGFSLKKLDKGHKVFFFLEFTKVREPPVKRGKLPILTLKPCIYKKR